MTAPRASEPPLENLEFQTSLVAAILEASPDGVLVVDAAGLIVVHNRRLLELFGIPPERLFGPGGGSLAGLPDRPLLAAVLELVAEPALFLERVAALYADPRLVDDCELSLKDGRTLERHSRALYGPDRQYLGRVWFFRDVSPRKRTEAALRELSRLDPLTGLANRREFFEVAKREFVRARRTGRALSFLMLDLDAFKRVNDDWGHATGDLVLKAVATCVAGALRAMDHFARIGGEEFVILAPDADGEAAFVLAERVRACVGALTVAADTGRIQVTVSLGVATLRAGDASPDDVLARADAAMYAAKRAGRNCSMRAE